MLSDQEKSNILHNLQQPDCQYEFIFVSPESALSDTFQKCLDTLNQRKELNMFIIDEAHCIENWGKDFRPTYQQLGLLRKYNVPFVALTGTATNRTINTISSVLMMTDHDVVKLPCRRNNLCFSVIPKKEAKAKQQIADIISKDFDGQCGIVYCSKQADTVEMAFQLKEKGISSTFMGVDKKCVRFVVHLTIPSSMEDYIQESGRGGRDGDSCFCVMLFRFADRFFHICNIAKLPASGGQELSLLNSFTDFCMQQSTCRQQFICEYFEESVGESCNICDICQEDTMIQEKDMTEHAKDIVECLISLNRHLKSSYLN